MPTLYKKLNKFDFLTVYLITSLFMSQQVRGDDVHDPTTYLVSFDDDEARYAVSPRIENLIFNYACTYFFIFVFGEEVFKGIVVINFPLQCSPFPQSLF